MGIRQLAGFPPTGADDACAAGPGHGSLAPSQGRLPKHRRGGAELADTVRFRKDLVQLLPRLRRFALTLSGNSADADDLVQMTCERAMLRASQWLAGTRLDSWMFTMMRNLWLSELRSRRVRGGAGQVDAAEAQELATEIGAADVLQGNQVAALILTLPEGLAATLLLVSVEGHSYQEAADVLGIPIGTVMSRMSKARQVMRQKLARASGEAAE